MHHFMVVLKIQAGEYIKSTQSLIAADDEASAVRIAIEGEAHGDLDWDDNGAYDLGGEFHYSMKRVKRVLPEHLDILHAYID
ncbi:MULTISPECIES: hypothetical protein [Buttiauxella]|jgi:hypothetical protein|uniref:hypothetical protein n=1 Tax=Enterobacterales TaxID=91347 RepID=UPI0010669FBE|nr:hypothetical protein [Buttiauxella sp. BIGb0552]TDX11884.1 hypothetical protein EDF88_4481 [Buttiauxella sp. BIGb0552]